MKKIITGVLTAALCISMTVSVFAAEVNSDGGKADTTLAYSVDADYMVVIPERVVLTQPLAISSSKANTEPGKAVKVRITEGLTDGSVSLDRDNDTSDYAITAKVKCNESDEKVDSDTVIAAFSDVTAEITGGTLTFDDPIAPDDNPVKAGSYTGSLTFTVSYENE